MKLLHGTIPVDTRQWKLQVQGIWLLGAGGELQLQHHAETATAQALMLAASVDCVLAVEVLLEKGATLELQARPLACRWLMSAPLRACRLLCRLPLCATERATTVHD